MHTFQKVALLLSSAFCFTACDTMHMPPPHGGRTSILINLHEQRAYLCQGSSVVSEASISTGREGHVTPAGSFHVIRKDIDHRSSLYGDYVDAGGSVVKANVDSRKDSRPPGSRYLGASMPYFVEFSPGFGLHEGHRPGYPASHGCVRLSHWKARKFYAASKIGTPVTVRP
ncbi:MAG: L,D-transpeptidase family protein [Chthoniobacteraceae bacterium]